MLDLLMLTAIVGYWVVAIRFFGVLQNDGRLSHTSSVIGAACWPLFAIASAILSIIGSLRREI